MKVLVIDDVISVRKGISSYLDGFDVIKKGIQLTMLEFDTSKNKETIKEEIRGKTFDVVFCDWGFYHSYIESDNIVVTEKWGDASDLFACFEGKEVIIYTYQPNSHGKFYADKWDNIIEKLNAIKPKNKFLIETSNYFRRLSGTGIYENFDDRLPNKIGRTCDFEEYGRFIGSLIIEYYQKFKLFDSANVSQFFDSNSINFNKSHSLFNELIKESGFNLSTISFLSKQINDYLLDMPFKPYYISLNDHIKKNSDITKFIEPDKECINIYNFTYRNQDGHFFFNEIKVKEKSGFKKLTNENPNYDILQKWLILLHYGIFYTTKNKYNWDTILQDISVEIKHQPEDQICIYWVIQKLSIGEGRSGFLNYSFYSTTKQGDDVFAENIHLIYSRIIESFAHESVFDWYERELMRTNTRASISQVMARNGSHNFGSHVLSRIVGQFLENLLLGHLTARQLQRAIKEYNEALDKTDLGEISAALDTLDKHLAEIKPENKTWAKRFTTSSYKPLPIADNDRQDPVELLATFVSFQKTLMDFLADITFGEPALEVTKLFFSDIMSSLDRNRIMLDLVSGSSYSYRFVVRNLIHTCTGLQNKNQYLPHCACVINGADNDIAVSMPNDILGSMAFYIILINLIRNAAKHGSRDGRTICNEIHIDISDDGDDEFYKITVFDDSHEPDTKKLGSLVETLNINLSTDINHEGKLRHGSWGLIEMAAAAAYLRKAPLEFINEPKYQPNFDNKEKPFLKAVAVQGKHLGYELFMLKPKELLVVMDGDTWEEKKLEKDFISQARLKGIELCDVTSIDKSKKYAYPLMLYIGSQTNWADVNNNNFPIRKLVCTGSDDEIPLESRFTHHLSQGEIGSLDFTPANATSLINSLWKLWIEKASGYLGVKNYSSKQLYSTSTNNSGRTHTLKNYDCGWKDLHREKKESLSISIDNHALGNCVDIVNNTNTSEYISRYAETIHSKDIPLLKKFLYCEILGENQTYDTKTNPADFPLLCKFIEGVDTTVFIVDERIQELAEKTDMSYKTDKVSVIDALYCSNVIVPRTYNGFSYDKDGKGIRPLFNNNPIFDLNESDFDKTHEAIIQYLSGCIKTKSDRRFNNTQADFLLIHLGIIEKLIKASNFHEGKKDKQDIKDFIEQKILCINLQNRKITDIDTKIVVISGRGKPSNLPNDTLFLNYSLVSQYCFDNRLKLLLSNLIYSSKPI